MKKKRGGDLRLSIASVDHRISASHLERIVRELLENAFKFSDPGTPVELESSLRGAFFQIEVSDYGRGFSPEQIKNVGANLQFDRKLQEQQGSGLGLAIVRRLAYTGIWTVTEVRSPGVL